LKIIYGIVISLAAPLLLAQQVENIPDFSGVWLGGARGAPQGGMGAQGAMGAQGGMVAPGGGRGRLRPTAAAQSAMDAYDLLVDDPAYLCSPGSINRGWRNPTPTEIEQHEDRVILRHEYMDVERVIYLDRRDHPADAEPNVVGNSIGWYEGSALVIDTTGFSPSVISPVSGLPQTEGLHAVERLTLSDDGQTLSRDVTLEDPATLLAPWVTTGQTFQRRPDMTLLPWDCVLEDAGYEIN
jgi:hypothetical protein